MITKTRDHLYDVILAAVPDRIAVHRWLPDDLGSTPCVAISRPTVSPDGPQGTWMLRQPVFVLGERTTSDDNQRELDDLTWTVLEAISRATPVGDVIDYGVSSADPRVTPVAHQEYPSYVINLVIYTNNMCR